MDKGQLREANSYNKFLLDEAKRNLDTTLENYKVTQQGIKHHYKQLELMYSTFASQHIINHRIDIIQFNLNLIDNFRYEIDDLKARIRVYKTRIYSA